MAIKFPILLYGKTKVFSVGKIDLECEIKRGIISFGRYVSSESIRPFNTWDNNGRVIIKGRLIINTGYLFRNYGLCEFGRNVNLGSNVEIFCQEKIAWGDNVRTAANGFYMDTDGHFMLDMNKNTVSRMTRPIMIGNSVWLGSSVRLKKGSVIPNKSIVASFSVLGKDYSNEGDHIVIGGVPATVLKRNVLPVLNLDEEIKLKENYFSDISGFAVCLNHIDESYLAETHTNFF